MWKKTRELTFIAGFLVVVALVLFDVLFGATQTTISSRRAARPDYDYPKLCDFLISLPSLVALVVLRVVLPSHVFSKIGDAVLPASKKGWDASTRAARVQRFGTVVFKFCYFVGVCAWAWYLFADAEFLPPALGGSGSIRLMFEGFPFQPVSDAAKLYFMVQLSYHCHSLVFQLTMQHRNDFLEMVLHHSVAIFLMVFAYLHNYIRISILVLFIHDIGDVVGYLIKACADTSHTKVTLSVYVLLLLSWGYTRLYVFPRYLIGTIYDMAFAYSAEYFVVFFLVLLSLLQCLHIYWYCLFLQMGYEALATGHTEDIQTKIPSKSDIASTLCPKGSSSDHAGHHKSS